MSVCYSCGTILNKKTQSNEHIIPNSIGGVLKSRRLLCRQCNSAYGMTIDAALAKEFENLAAFINVERDRSKSYLAKNAVAANGRSSVPVKPTIKFEAGRLYISGRDRQQVIAIALGLKGRFPDIDRENVVKENHEDYELSDGDFTINFSLGSDLFMRAVAKIAVNYYLMKVRGGQYLDDIIKVINGGQVNNHHIYYHPLPGVHWGDNEVSHIIAVRGDSVSKQLHAQVILFNTYSLVINLCDDYNGNEIDLFYRYDIISKQEINHRIDLGL